MQPIDRRLHMGRYRFCAEAVRPANGNKSNHEAEVSSISAQS